MAATTPRDLTLAGTWVGTTISMALGGINRSATAPLFIHSSSASRTERQTDKQWQTKNSSVHEIGKRRRFSVCLCVCQSLSL